MACIPRGVKLLFQCTKLKMKICLNLCFQLPLQDTRCITKLSTSPAVILSYIVGPFCLRGSRQLSLKSIIIYLKADYKSSCGGPVYSYIFIMFIPVVYVYVEVDQFLSTPSLYFTIHIVSKYIFRHPVCSLLSRSSLQPLQICNYFRLQQICNYSRLQQTCNYSRI